MLVHAGAGGVGMAAIQLAHAPRRRGLRHRQPGQVGGAARGRPRRGPHRLLARPRLQGQVPRRRPAARESTSSSTRWRGSSSTPRCELLPRGGRFLEMGKTDIRDPERVAAEHPGVSYRAFDLVEAGPRAAGRDARRGPRPLRGRRAAPFAARRAGTCATAPDAFRHLREGRNVGKVVLSIAAADRPRDDRADHRRHRRPRRPDRPPPGRRARRPPPAPGQPQRPGGRGGEGAGVGSSRSWGQRRRSPPATSPTARQLEELLASVPTEHPLGAVIHSAGALDDGTIESLGAEQLERVFAPKADARLAPARADRGRRTSPPSSSSPRPPAPWARPARATTPPPTPSSTRSPHRRRAEGLPATSIAWGLWQRESGMTSQPRRGRPGADCGARASEALGDEQGLALFDAALGSRALRWPWRSARPRRAARPGGGRRAAADPHAAWFARPPAGAAPASGSLGGEARRRCPRRSTRPSCWSSSAARPPRCSATPRRRRSSPVSAFKELGFDSLAAVELRNRLNTATGLQLAATVVFDHPSPEALAAHLLAEVDAGGCRPSGSSSGPRPATSRSRSSAWPAAIPGGVSSPEGLWELVAAGRDGIAGFPADRGWDLERLYHPDPDQPRHQLRARGRLPRRRRPSSTPSSSASPRARRWRWIPSSGCCWRPPGRRWRTPASTPPPCAGSRPASSPG